MKNCSTITDTANTFTSLNQLFLSKVSKIVFIEIYRFQVTDKDISRNTNNVKTSIFIELNLNQSSRLNELLFIYLSLLIKSIDNLDANKNSVINHCLKKMSRSIRSFYVNDCNSRCTGLVFQRIASGSNCKSNNYLHTQERTQSTEPQELHAKRQFREAIDVHCAGNFQCASCKSSQVFKTTSYYSSQIAHHYTQKQNSISYLACSNTHTHTLASISSYLHTYILILGYSILLINLLFLFYLNPFQMSLSSVCIDRIDAKLYQRLSKIVSNKTSRKLFPKYANNIFHIFNYHQTFITRTCTQHFTVQFRRASFPFHVSVSLSRVMVINSRNTIVLTMRHDAREFLFRVFLLLRFAKLRDVRRS